MCHLCTEHDTFFEIGEIYVYVPDEFNQECPNPTAEIVLVLARHHAHPTAMGVQWIILDMSGSVHTWGLRRSRRRKMQ